MPACTTNGIKISVITRYEAQHSSIPESRYVFSYKITIINESDHTVQLLSRHWYINDSNCNNREVKGEGVVGEQPILSPGASHSYVSWCPFKTEVGMMKGYFIMSRQIDHELIKVDVPDFTMVATPRLN